jgi:hypothetical protein
MKKFLIAVAVAAAVLAPAGYFGKQYLDENYVLLNAQEVAELDMYIRLVANQAFEVGKAVCNKTL